MGSGRAAGGSVAWGGGGAGEEFLEGVEEVSPLSPACSSCPPHPAAELPQGWGGPPGQVCGEVGGGL